MSNPGEAVEGLFNKIKKRYLDLPLHANQSRLISDIIKYGNQTLSESPHKLERTSHPSGRYNIGAVDLEKSHGPYLYTSRGKYFDASYSWMTNIVDSGKHPELQNPALFNFLGRLAFEDQTPTEIVTAVQTSFIDMMMGFWQEAYKVLPVSAGTLATDDAIEIAIGQVSDKLRRKPQELKGIAFEGSFHGRVGKGADGTANKKKVGHKHTNKIDHVTAPIVQFDDVGIPHDLNTRKMFEKSMQEVEEKLSKDEYAYVIIEYPIQAEGGARIVNPEALKNIHDLCQKYGKVLIVDDVQMGGRSWTTDKNFVSPFTKEVLQYADIITFGKVFHANGTMVRDFTKLDRGFNSNWVDTNGPDKLGGTWTGHLSQMASGYAIMKTVVEKKLWNNGLMQTNHILTNLQEMVTRYSHLLANARGRSDTAYLAWSFQQPGMRNLFKQLMMEEEHIIFLPAGDDSIRLAPAADMTREEADAILIAIENQLIRMSENN